MADETITDINKVIDLATRKPRKPRLVNKAKGRSTKTTARSFVKEVGEELHKIPDRPLTEEETIFVDAVRNGYAFGESFKMAFPDLAIKEIITTKDKEIEIPYDPMVLHDKGWSVARRSAVARTIGQALDREAGLEAQDSKRLRNFVRKRLEMEATNASSPAARIAALTALGKTEGIDAFLERRKDMSEPAQEDVLDEITQLIKKLTA